MKKFILHILLLLITTISLPLMAANISETNSGNEMPADQQRVYAETVIENEPSEIKNDANGLLKANAYIENGKLTVKTSDNAFKVMFDNRVYLDAAAYFPVQNTDAMLSKPNKDIETDDGKFRFSNGISVRRARFGVKASLYEKWFAELDLDFAYNEVEIKDLFLGYKFNDKMSLKFGNFKEPMSMERITSSRYLANMERPMVVDALVPGRNIGLTLTAWNKHWWTSGGFFTQKPDLLHKEKNRGNDGYAFTGRAALSPIATENMTVHLGAYGTYRTPSSSGMENRFVEFRTFPESRVDRRRFVRTEIPNVNHYVTTGVELAFRHDKLLVYGEYILTNLSRYKISGGGEKTALKNALFDGWYGVVSYMLIGKNRQYEPADAEFGPVCVKKRGGNLELTGRISAVNLNDFNDATEPITGGQAMSYSASLNWYPNSNVLIGLNYVFMNNDKYANDKGHITVNGEAMKTAMPSGLDFHIVQLRTLVSF